MSSRARALQLSLWTSWLTRESRDGVCSRRVQNFLSSSPVVRKGGAREMRHQLSLRTEPRETHCREVSNEIASQF